MAREAELRRVVAEFLEVDPDSLAPATELGARVSSSLARAGLDAALRRRLGVKCAAVYTAREYGELEAAVLGKDGAPTGSGEDGAPTASGKDGAPTASGKDGAPTASGKDGAPTGRAVGHADVRCGVDIVEVGELPETGDYWEHDFYRHSFTPAEIAYCLMQPHPREHFAARWAAKEAAKKLSPDYLRAELKDLEVDIGTHGQPALKRHGLPLPVALSLSHTSSTAVAVVVSAPARQELAASALPKRTDFERGAGLVETRLARAPWPRRTARRFARLMPGLLWLATSGAAAWALVRTFQ